MPQCARLARHHWAPTRLCDDGAHSAAALALGNHSIASHAERIFDLIAWLWQPPCCPRLLLARHTPAQSARAAAPIDPRARSVHSNGRCGISVLCLAASATSPQRGTVYHLPVRNDIQLTEARIATEKASQTCCGRRAAAASRDACTGLGICHHATRQSRDARADERVLCADGGRLTARLQTLHTPHATADADRGPTVHRARSRHVYVIGVYCMVYL